ncbi:hypothetical protein H5410_033477 [Solanum commersonii]|uniref:Tudor domain-containing protein n=1 Tax=Solanum commersonii TaxID=4109 RepID=A0A9J5YMX4_SOLCO|nr:hypothetical protein H5410_033477 [Solanum commersonii]
MLEDNSSQKDSKRPCSIKDYGKELVGDRIKVWWPLDEKFYEGVISSFDFETNKYEVVYDDGEVEILRLHKERWKMLEDNSSRKDSKRTCTIKDYGKELVGARIKVWWPLDEKFYGGVVSSFDPVERKHKVVYDDGEAEKLRLHKERWEMLEDNSTQKDHGLDFQGHAVSSAT